MQTQWVVGEEFGSNQIVASSPALLAPPTSCPFQRLCSAVSPELAFAVTSTPSPAAAASLSRARL